MVRQRYVDLLGKDYKEFSKACHRHGVYENLTAAQMPGFMREVILYMRDKPGVDLWFAVKQMSRY